MGIPCNKYFIAGFIMLVVVPLPLDLVALANAGQSLILAVGTGCTVIFGQIVAPKVLKESLTRYDILATFLITIGVFISTLTGTHETPVYTSTTLLHLYTYPAIIVTITMITISTVVCICIAHSQELEDKLIPQWLLIPYQAYIPSSLGGLQIMVFKMVGELGKKYVRWIRGSHGDKESGNKRHNDCSSNLNCKRVFETNDLGMHITCYRSSDHTAELLKPRTCKIQRCEIFAHLQHPLVNDRGNKRGNILSRVQCIPSHMVSYRCDI